MGGAILPLLVRAPSYAAAQSDMHRQKSRMPQQEATQYLSKVRGLILVTSVALTRSFRNWLIKNGVDRFLEDFRGRAEAPQGFLLDHWGRETLTTVLKNATSS